MDPNFLHMFQVVVNEPNPSSQVNNLQGTGFHSNINNAAISHESTNTNEPVFFINSVYSLADTSGSSGSLSQQHFLDLPQGASSENVTSTSNPGDHLLRSLLAPTPPSVKPDLTEKTLLRNISCNTPANCWKQITPNTLCEPDSSVLLSSTQPLLTNTIFMPASLAFTNSTQPIVRDTLCKPASSALTNSMLPIMKDTLSKPGSSALTNSMPPIMKDTLSKPASSASTSSTYPVVSDSLCKPISPSLTNSYANRTPLSSVLGLKDVETLNSANKLLLEKQEPNTNAISPDIVDVETEDVDDCMLVKVEPSKCGFSFGKRINNLEVVIDDSDEDDADQHVNDEEKSQTVQVEKNKDSKVIDKQVLSLAQESKSAESLEKTSCQQKERHSGSLLLSTTSVSGNVHYLSVSSDSSQHHAINHKSVDNEGNSGSSKIISEQNEQSSIGILSDNRTEPKKVCCKLCTAVFTTRSSLVSHMLLNHKTNRSGESSDSQKKQTESVVKNDIPNALAVSANVRLELSSEGKSNHSLQDYCKTNKTENHQDAKAHSIKYLTSQNSKFEKHNNSFIQQNDRQKSLTLVSDSLDSENIANSGAASIVASVTCDNTPVTGASETCGIPVTATVASVTCVGTSATGSIASVTPIQTPVSSTSTTNTTNSAKAMETVNLPPKLWLLCECCSLGFPNYSCLMEHVRIVPVCKAYHDEMLKKQFGTGTSSKKTVKHISCKSCARKFDSKAKLSKHLFENPNCKKSTQKSGKQTVSRKPKTSAAIIVPDAQIAVSNVHSLPATEPVSVVSFQTVTAPVAVIDSRPVAAAVAVVDSRPIAAAIDSRPVGAAVNSRPVAAAVDSRLVAAAVAVVDSRPVTAAVSETNHTITLKHAEAVPSPVCIICNSCKTIFKEQIIFDKHFQSSPKCLQVCDQVKTQSPVQPGVDMSQSPTQNPNASLTGNFHPTAKTTATLQNNKDEASTHLSESILNEALNKNPKDDNDSDESGSSSDENSDNSSSSNEDALIEYKCKHCGTSFNHKSAFKKHLKSHKKDSVERNISKIKIHCKVCKKKFKDNTGLQAHLLQRRFCFLHVTRAFRDSCEQGSHTCQMCKKSLPSALELSKHCYKILTCRLRYIDLVLQSIIKLKGSSAIETGSNTQRYLNESTVSPLNKVEGAPDSGTHIIVSSNQQQPSQEDLCTKETSSFIGDCLIPTTNQTTWSLSSCNIPDVDSVKNCTVNSVVLNNDSVRIKCRNCNESYTNFVEHILTNKNCLEYFETHSDHRPNPVAFCFQCRRKLKSYQERTIHVCRPFTVECSECGLRYLHKQHFVKHFKLKHLKKKCISKNDLSQLAKGSSAVTRSHGQKSLPSVKEKSAGDSGTVVIDLSAQSPQQSSNENGNSSSTMPYIGSKGKKCLCCNADYTYFIKHILNHKSCLEYYDMHPDVRPYQTKFCFKCRRKFKCSQDCLNHVCQPDGIECSECGLRFQKKFFKNHYTNKHSFKCISVTGVDLSVPGPSHGKLNTLKSLKKLEVPAPNKNCTISPVQRGNISSGKKCKNCNVVYINFVNHILNSKKCLEYFEAHPELRPVRIPFCFQCRKKYKNVPKWEKHICVSNKHECPDCGLRYKHFRFLQLHCENIHKKTFIDQGTVPNHKDSNDSCNSGYLNQQSNFPCLICSSKFSTLRLLMEHSYQHVEEIPLVCKRCSTTFYHYNRFVSHQAYHIRMDRDAGTSNLDALVMENFLANTVPAEACVSLTTDTDVKFCESGVTASKSLVCFENFPSEEALKDHSRHHELSRTSHKLQDQKKSSCSNIFPQQHVNSLNVLVKAKTVASSCKLETEFHVEEETTEPLTDNDSTELKFCIPNPSENTILVCLYCDQMFQSPKEKYEHLVQSAPCQNIISYILNNKLFIHRPADIESMHPNNFVPNQCVFCKNCFSDLTSHLIQSPCFLSFEEAVMKHRNAISQVTQSNLTNSSGTCICDICSKVFLNVTLLDQHKSSAHMLSPLPDLNMDYPEEDHLYCFRCKTFLKSISSVMEHSNSVHCTRVMSNKIMQNMVCDDDLKLCRICNKIFPVESRQSLINHMFKVHNKGSSKLMNFCIKQGDDSRNNMSQKTNFSIKSKYCCSLCGVIITGPSRTCHFEMHMRNFINQLKCKSSKPMKAFSVEKCPVCKNILHSKCSLKSHLARHRPQDIMKPMSSDNELKSLKLSACPHCKRWFKSAAALKFHIVRFHNSKVKDKKSPAKDLVKWTDSTSNLVKRTCTDQPVNFKIKINSQDQMLCVESDVYVCKLCTEELVGITATRSHLQMSHNVLTLENLTDFMVKQEKPTKTSELNDINLSRPECRPGFSLRPPESTYLQCHICKSSIAVIDFLSHLTEVHSWSVDKMFTCAYCNLVFPYENLLSKHQDQCVMDLECRICYSYSKSVRSFTNHLRQKHDMTLSSYVKSKFSCSFIKINNDGLRILNINNSTSVTRVCLVCYQEFTESIEYRKHLESHLKKCWVVLEKVTPLSDLESCHIKDDHLRTVTSFQNLIPKQNRDYFNGKEPSSSKTTNLSADEMPNLISFDAQNDSVVLKSLDTKVIIGMPCIDKYESLDPDETSDVNIMNDDDDSGALNVGNANVIDHNYSQKLDDSHSVTVMDDSQTLNIKAFSIDEKSNQTERIRYESDDLTVSDSVNIITDNVESQMLNRKRSSSDEEYNQGKRIKYESLDETNTESLKKYEYFQKSMVERNVFSAFQGNATL